MARVRHWERGHPWLALARQIATHGLRLARRSRGHQDRILRFATGLTIGFAFIRPNATSAP